MTLLIEPPRTAKPKRTNWEKWGWIYMRVSGVALIVLVFGHLFANLWVGKGIAAIDFAFVAGKWADPFWQIWDLLMLWLALLHGTNGMRTIVNDYAEREKTRKTLVWILWATCAALIVLGTLVIYTFDPCPANGTPENLPSFCPVNQS